MSSYFADHWLVLLLEGFLPLGLAIYVFYKLAVRHLKLARAGLYYNKKKPRTVKYKQIYLISWLFCSLYEIFVLYFPQFESEDETFSLFYR